MLPLLPSRMKTSSSIFCAVLALSACGPAALAQTASEPDPAPTDVPGLLAFWDFQEPAGTPRLSKGRYAYALEEMNGPIRRADDGVFGPHSADLDWGQWLRAKREDAPGLDLHGSEQEVTVVAWVKRESDRVWQYIAGVWDEGDAAHQGEASGTGEGAPGRQYGLFMSGAWQTDHTTYERTRAEHQAMGYVSATGGATPGHPFAFDYATGATFLEQDRWYMLAYTFNGEALRVYVDGQLDANGNYNPFPYDGPIYEGGADFTVALRRVPKWPAYPEGVPENAAGFDGRLGGLAVYGRALTSEEVAGLYQATLAD